MKKATVWSEDKDFYDHRGVSPTALVRAAVSNSRGNRGTQNWLYLDSAACQAGLLRRSGEASERGLAGIPRKIESHLSHRGGAHVQQAADS